MARFSTLSRLSSTCSRASNRGLVAHSPGDFIQAMDMLFDIEVAGRPSEVLPVAKLPFHVAPFRLARELLQRVGVIGRLNRDDVADCAFMNLLERGSHSVIVSPAQARDDSQVFLGR